MIAERDGRYVDALLGRGNPVRRFTAYVSWDPDDPNGTEEIDVDAVSVRHAREIAAAALKRDYDPGGRILHVEETGGL